MAALDLFNLALLIDDAKCFALVRQHRWSEGVRCPGCGSDAVVRHGRDDTQPQRQRYRCKACADRFDDLTGTVLAGHHQPLRVRVLCLYFMGLNLSSRQIARELGLSQPDVQLMTEQLRHGLTARLPAATLEGGVEIDEVHVVAGHKGQPKAVAKRGDRDGVAGWRERRPAARWRGTSRPSSAGSGAAGRWCCGCWPMSSRGRPSRSSGPRSPGTPSSTPTSTTSTPGWKSGGTGTKPCVTPGASTRATRTATASARSTSTRWRASGPCCAPGSGPIAAPRGRSCRSTSPSSGSCATPGAGVGPSSVNSSPPWWREVPTTPDPDKSDKGNPPAMPGRLRPC